jgi:hypothetical protein
MALAVVVALVVGRDRASVAGVRDLRLAGDLRQVSAALEAGVPELDARRGLEAGPGLNLEERLALEQLSAEGSLAFAAGALADGLEASGRRSAGQFRLWAPWGAIAFTLFGGVVIAGTGSFSGVRTLFSLGGS